MNEIQEKIKRRGYWEIIIRPTKFQEDFIESPAKCEKIIRDIQVRLRGWYYPYYRLDNPPVTGLDYIEQAIDWSYFLEFWRYYQSGMFIHFFGMIEDWQDQAHEGRKWNLPPSKTLTIISTLYIITEIYEFASRLANKNLLGRECVIYICLYDTKDRQLIMLDPRRHTWGEYKCVIEKIPRELTLSSDQLITNSSELSMDHAIWLFQRFNWKNPPRGVLKEDQQKLLKGLI